MTARDFLALIRPHQWVKNFLVFAALLFSGQFTEPTALFHASVVFVGFCGLASAGYVVNDWVDRERDRHHPDKADRPLASGALSGYQAILVGGLCLAVPILTVMLLPWTAGRWVAMTYGAYALLMLGYDLGLKNVFGLELIIVATGLVLRAVAGGVGIRVPLTGWFLLTIFFLCFMVVSGKRRHERVLLDERGGRHRPVLDEYRVQLLDALVIIAASASVVTYSLWTVRESAAGTLPDAWATASVLFVLYGLARYLQHLYRGDGGAPEEIFTHDWKMVACVGAWSAYMVAMVLL
jgi:4-hydroxybenzoate polyprenyltransferase